MEEVGGGGSRLLRMTTWKTGSFAFALRSPFTHWPDAPLLSDNEALAKQRASPVLPWGLDESTVTLRARWWTSSTRRIAIHIKAEVILAIRRVAVEHAIDLPYPTTTVLLHDQTDMADGDRARQREGWPARGSDSPAGTTPPRCRASSR